MKKVPFIERDRCQPTIEENPEIVDTGAEIP
jgi:hypothetical protein